MAGNDHSFIGQGQHFLVQGTDDLLHRPSRQIGAAYASRKQSVSGDQFLLRRKVQTNAALGVPRSMNDIRGERACLMVSDCPML